MRKRIKNQSKFDEALTDYRQLIKKQKILEGQKVIASGIDFIRSSGDYPELVEEMLAAQGAMEPTEDNARKLMATIEKAANAVNEIRGAR